MSSKIFLIIFTISIVINGCFFNLAMDRVTFYKINEEEEYVHYTKCGQLKMGASSALKDLYELRIYFRKEIDVIYPQQLEIIDRDEHNLPYEIWWSDNQITEKAISVKDGYTLSYFIKTQQIEGVRFWADSLIR